MTAPTSWTMADLAALEDAIKSGASEVRFADRVVTYRSLDDMLKLRNVIQVALGVAGDRRTHYARFKKGPRPGYFPGTGRQRIS